MTTQQQQQHLCDRNPAPPPPLVRTTNDAVAISHEVQGVAGHVGDRDAEQLFGFVYVPQPDILLRAGRK